MKVDPNMTDSPVLVFDIETRQTTDAKTIERLTAAAGDQRPASNTAKAIKEAWDSPGAINARVIGALTKTSLDPLLAEVVAVGWATVESGQLAVECLAAYDEQSYLGYFAREWESLCSDRNRIFVGHHIKGFDLPILLNRMRHYGIIPPARFPQWSGRYWRGRIHDCMDHFPGQRYISAAEACRYYGIERNPIMYEGSEITGARVQDLVDAEEWPLLQQYCAGDVLDEFAIYCAQTANERCPSYDIGSGGISAAMKDIDEADALTDGAKWLTARIALKSAGIL